MFNPWIRKIPWSRKCQPTPVFLEIPWTVEPSRPLFMGLQESYSVTKPPESKYCVLGCLGGSVVRNPHANAGDTGQSLTRKILHVTGQLSQCATTTQPVLRAWKPQLLSPHATAAEAHAPYSSCSTTGEATTIRTQELQLENSLCLHNQRVASAWATREKPAQQQRPSANKNTNKFFTRFLSVCPKIKYLPKREEITLFIA